MDFNDKEKIGALGGFVFVVFIIYSSIITNSIKDNFGGIVSSNFDRIFETYKVEFFITLLILLALIFIIKKYYKLDISENKQKDIFLEDKIEEVSKPEIKKSNVISTNHKKINILLPHKLDRSFSDIFNFLGYNTIWSHDIEVLNKMIDENEIHLAFEWQWGVDDHTIRDTLKQYNKNTPVILCLNYNNKLPEDFDKLGYSDYIEVPFETEKIKYLVKKHVKLK